MYSTRNTNKGIFVVFEGLDGSGTTTQAHLLHEAMLSRGVEAYVTSEPTNGPVGNLIRLAMSHRLLFGGTSREDDRQLAYLFAADRFDHLYNQVDGILSRINSGAMVISTRYYLSSFAYHCTEDEDFNLVARLNADFPPAHITFFLDCPIDMCLERIMRSRIKPEIYENRQKLETVRKNYLKAIKTYKEPLFILDGSSAAHELHHIVLQHVQTMIGMLEVLE